MKTELCSLLGIIGGAIATLYGGWDAAMTTLVIFMMIDYFSGLACAGIFKKSPKSKNGGLESKAGFKGLCRKFMVMLFVLVAYRLDLLIGSTFCKDGVIIAFICNEAISIIENAGIMGLPIPSVITKAIDTLQDQNK